MNRSIDINNFEILRNQSKLNIIDVRETEDFIKGHIQGSVNIPLVTLIRNPNMINKNVTYYLICQTGFRSEAARIYLTKLGFNVFSVIGGMDSYSGFIDFK